VLHEQCVIWTASSINGFERKPGRRTCPSMKAYEQAIAVRQQRLMREVDALRRTGVEETILQALARWLYKCFPSGEAPPKR
jgi:hypothetical protein